MRAGGGDERREADVATCDGAFLLQEKRMTSLAVIFIPLDIISAISGEFRLGYFPNLFFVAYAI